MLNNESQTQKNSFVAWMIKNPIAVNLLMILFIVGGYIFLQNTQEEVFPTIKPDIISITVRYPGAEPKEIERSILQSIEASVDSLSGVKKVYSQASRGFGRVDIEYFDFVDKLKLRQDIEIQVDSISSFPNGIERPEIKLVEIERPAISVVIYGQQKFLNLYEYSVNFRRNLLALPDVSKVNIENSPIKEISIEVNQLNLQKYNLSLNSIAEKLRNYARELSGGTIETSQGNISIKTNERRSVIKEFKEIPIINNPNDASTLKLGDIANIKKRFRNSSSEQFYNGLPSYTLTAFSTEKQSPVDLATSVKKYINQLDSSEQSIKVEILNDRSKIYQDRINLLLKSALSGVILILIILGLFLEVRLAFWVMLGIPISFLGSFLLFGYFDATLNMVSLFAFMITLGIVVDDAIIIGESIYSQREQGKNRIQAAIVGTNKMFRAICFAIITNIVAFIPLMLVPGTTGDIFRQIPAVVISVLTISLIESLYILPSHLSHEKKNNSIWKILNKPQEKFSKIFESFTQKTFRKIVTTTVNSRYSTLAAAIGIIIISFSIIASGRLGFSFIPKIPRDRITITAYLQPGISRENTQKTAKTIVKQIQEAKKTLTKKEKIIQGISTRLFYNSNERLVFTINLLSSEERSIETPEILAAVRKKLNKNIPPSVYLFNFSGRIGFGGKNSDIELEVLHPSTEIQKKISQEITSELNQIEGVKNANDGISLGQPELSFTLTSKAQALGLNTNMIASQVRNSFFGREAFRQQDGFDEIRVITRLPLDQKQTLDFTENFLIQLPQGGYANLKDLVFIDNKRSTSIITRTAGQRALSITADVDEKSNNNKESILIQLKKRLDQYYKSKYPDMSYSFEGEANARDESVQFLGIAFIFTGVILFAFLAIPFKSYLHPLTVMLSIPFGIIGAIFGHMLLGYNISIVSIIGLIGLTGIVINDALILLMTLEDNRKQQPNEPLIKITIESTIQRFRPILLTSLTTFFGLMPLLFEKSIQAKFLVPMAISISFGIAFATIIILLLIPSLFLILNDLKNIFSKKETV